MKIVCKLSEDGFEVEESKIINLNCKKAFKYTFWKQNNTYAEFYKDEAIDMLYLSLAVFAADRLILRIDGDRKESEEKVGKSNCEECEYIKNLYVFWWTGFLYRRIKLTL